MFDQQSTSSVSLWEFCLTILSDKLKGALPPETEARNRKLTVFAMSLYISFSEYCGLTLLLQME